MIDSRRLWRGFAPRNMFLHEGAIQLIDFEDVVSNGTPMELAQCLQWQRIYFADALTEEEQQFLFGGFDFAEDSQAVLPADSFERALLGRENLTWDERRALLETSKRLESHHVRPTRDREDGILHAHALGNYWGDFVALDVEVEIFRSLQGLQYGSELTACLEVFEAAAEADICDGLLARAVGRPESTAERTRALAEQLAACGSKELAEARNAVGNWYERLQADPIALSDYLILALATRPPGLTSDSVNQQLIGMPSMRQHHEDTLGKVINLGMNFLHRSDENLGFLEHVDASTLANLASMPCPEDPSSIDEVLDTTDQLLSKYSIAQSHPDYLAFPDSGNALGAVAGSLLTPFLNQNMIAVDRSAPIATFLEIQVVEWLRELVGYEALPVNELKGVKDVAGLWTTGGHLSNHLAMLIALGQHFPEARESGLRALEAQPLVVMSGPIAHYSHSDAAFHLGLGWNGVLSVGADNDFSTDAQAVDEALQNPPAGTRPFMVVGVAGNCRTTGLDDLRALSDICRKHGVWFHIDACHGGSLIFNKRLKNELLGGIELGDSISIDPHKGLFTPYPSSYILLKDRRKLVSFSRHDQMVLDDDCWDLGLVMPFMGSRGFHSLATWMMMKHIGTQQLGKLVEARQAFTRYMERRLWSSAMFVPLNDVDFYRLTFVFCPPAVRSHIANLSGADIKAAAGIVSEYTAKINAELYESGSVCFDEHTLTDLDNRVGLGADMKFTIMAACPGNPLLEPSRLETSMHLLEEKAQQYVRPMLNALVSKTEAKMSRIGGPAGWG